MVVRVESLVWDSTVDVRDTLHCLEWAHAATTILPVDAAIPLCVYSCFEMHQPSAGLW
jgi:hypothetical protein